MMVWGVWCYDVHQGRCSCGGCMWCDTSVGHLASHDQLLDESLSLALHAHSHVGKYTSLYIHTHQQMHIHTSTCPCIYIYIHVHTFTYIYIGFHTPIIHPWPGLHPWHWRDADWRDEGRSVGGRGHSDGHREELHHQEGNHRQERANRGQCAGKWEWEWLLWSPREDQK